MLNTWATSQSHHSCLGTPRLACCSEAWKPGAEVGTTSQTREKGIGDLVGSRVIQDSLISVLSPLRYVVTPESQKENSPNSFSHHCHVSVVLSLLAMHWLVTIWSTLCVCSGHFVSTCRSWQQSWEIQGNPKPYWSVPVTSTTDKFWSVGVWQTKASQWQWHQTLFIPTPRLFCSILLCLLYLRVFIKSSCSS